MRNKSVGGMGRYLTWTSLHNTIDETLDRLAQKQVPYPDT